MSFCPGTYALLRAEIHSWGLLDRESTSEDEFEPVQHSCILDPTARTVMPRILSLPGGKHQQAHDLCGFDISGSVSCLEEPM